MNQASRSSWTGAVARLAIRWTSRLVNAWRLRGRPDHRQRIRRSRRILAKLRSRGMRGEAGRCFAYLRKVEPLAFEEIVLTAFEDAGCLVLRNLSYSGDGGIDGRCMPPGSGWRQWGLQVKRYDGHVTARHVAQFGAAVVRHGLAGGLFVHCGRTGALSYTTARTVQIQVVSGDGLLALLLHQHLPGLRGLPQAMRQVDPSLRGKGCPSDQGRSHLQAGTRRDR